MFNAEGIMSGLGKSLSQLWSRKGEIAMAHVNGIIGGAKGLHKVMTMDASQVKGGELGKKMFSFLTLKANASSGAHVGYEIVPAANVLWTRSLSYTNLLTYDTIYTVGAGEMYSVSAIPRHLYFYDKCQQCGDNQTYGPWGVLYNK